MSKFESRLKALEAAVEQTARNDPAAVFYFAVHHDVTDVPPPRSVNETTREYLERWSTKSLRELLETRA